MTGSSESNLNRGDSDPFSHLHKMSTTAGLGSGDYVAINAAAVVALLLGAGSATVLFNNLFFLIFPVLGVITGIIAWRQIAESNGTQTGREVAAIGLLLALGFGGFAGFRTVYGSFRNHSDEVQIVSQLQKLGSLLKGEDYAGAYAMFDTPFRKRVPRSEFESKWRGIATSPILGNVQSIDWNKLLSFDIDPVDDSRVATGMMLMKCKPDEPLRVSMSFRFEDGNWLVDQIPQMFPADEGKQPKKNPGPSGPSSPYLGPPAPDAGSGSKPQ
jgi:hypothetical protein